MNDLNSILVPSHDYKEIRKRSTKEEDPRNAPKKNYRFSTPGLLDPKLPSLKNTQSKWNENEFALQVPFFPSDFCQSFIAELEKMKRFHRDVSLDIIGINLFQFGFGPFLDKIAEFLTPVLQEKFPLHVGTEGLVGYSIYAIKYEHGVYIQHPAHKDHSDMTVNICLGGDFKGGELEFTDNSKSQKMFQIPGSAIIHSGSTTHAAAPITKGSRYNLILWLNRRDSFPQFNLLPKSMQVEILSHLPLPDFSGLSLTSKGMASLSSEEFLWKKFFERDLAAGPIPASDGKEEGTWKQKYKITREYQKRLIEEEERKKMSLLLTRTMLPPTRMLTRMRVPSQPSFQPQRRMPMRMLPRSAPPAQPLPVLKNPTRKE